MLKELIKFIGFPDYINFYVVVLLMLVLLYDMLFCNIILLLVTDISIVSIKLVNSFIKNSILVSKSL